MPTSATTTPCSRLSRSPKAPFHVEQLLVELLQPASRGRKGLPPGDVIPFKAAPHKRHVGRHDEQCIGAPDVARQQAAEALVARLTWPSGSTNASGHGVPKLQLHRLVRRPHLRRVLFQIPFQNTSSSFIVGFFLHFQLQPGAFFC